MSLKLYMILKKDLYSIQEFIRDKLKKQRTCKILPVIYHKKVNYFLFIVGHIYRVRANQYVSIG